MYSSKSKIPANWIGAALKSTPFASEVAGYHDSVSLTLFLLSLPGLKFNDLILSDL